MTARLFKQRDSSKQQVDLLFLNDALDLFAARKSGHMSPYTFSSPLLEMADDPVRGEEYWRKFILHSQDYYTIGEETALINRYAIDIGALLPSAAICIDLGPGEKRAVLGKTIPFLSGLRQPAQYIAIDINPAFAIDAASLVGDRIKTPSYARCQDFLEQGIDFDNAKDRIFFLFGGGLCNFGRTRGNALRELSKSFSKLRCHMRTGDTLVITQDSNQDRDDLYAAYNHPDLAAHFLSLPHRIYRDLPTENFFPQNFQFALDWNKDDHLLTFNAVPNNNSKFKIANHTFEALTGKPYALVNCYKFPVEKFIYAASCAGFEPIRLFKSPYSRIALHILRAC